MKKVLILLLCSAFAFVTFATSSAIASPEITPAYKWHTFYGSGENAGNGIAADSSGNVYITGQSDAAWNGPAGQSPLNPYVGGTEIFVMKLNSSGEYQWHTFYGSGTGNDYGNGIAVDNNGDVYVTGESNTTWNGPEGVSPLNAYSGSAAVFVMKLNSSGEYQWHTFYGSGETAGNGIAVDGSGDVYVTGYGYDMWNGPAGETPLNAYSGSAAIFVLKLSSGGDYQWHTFYGSVYGYDAAYGLAVDSIGNVYATGQSDAAWNGPTDQSPLNAYNGGAEIFVLKLNNSGAYQWHTFYGSGYDTAFGIATDGGGDVYVTGQSDASWNGSLGQDPLNVYSGGTEVFVLKLSSSGAYGWHTFYGSGSDYASGIAADGSGDVYVTGYGYDTWNGPLGQDPLNAYAGNAAIFVLKLNSGGYYQWHTFYGSGYDYAFGIAADDIGAVYVTGQSDSTWNGPAGQNPLNAFSGGVDVVVVKLSELTVPGAPTGVTAVAGDAQAIVSFTGPASDGGSPITSYTVTSSPGNITATRASSPITVTGLTNGTSYTFTVTAANAIGTGPASDPSNSITPIQAGDPKISVKPGSLNFGSLKTGAMSDPKTVTVTNKGNGGLVINSITITGANADEFSQTNSCGVISPGESCTISVTLSPTIPFENKVATMEISSNDLKKPTVNVKLKGKASPPRISVSPKSGNFGSIGVGNTSAPETISITNKGVSDLIISDISITGTNAGEFSQTNSCGVISPGASCTISVTFSPTLPFEKKTAAMGISSNDPKKPMVNVKLKGTASPPKISVSPRSANFGSVGVGNTSAPETISITNKGISDLEISDISITGTNADEFSQTNSCGTIPTGGSCTIDVTFAPLFAGKKSASVDISSNDPKHSDVNVRLSGSGTSD